MSEKEKKEPIKKYKSRMIVTDRGNVNHLIIKSETSLEARKNTVLKELSNDFNQKLVETFGDGAERFSKPNVITDGIHSGSTMRSDCQAKTELGDTCSVRVTIGAVMAEDTRGPWVLETRPLNIDRTHNACEECKSQVYQRSSQ